jgi:chromosome condensin MukBEF ATPase and DNA-binding subunit MukB
MAQRKVTVQEAAEALDTSVDAIRQRIKRGKLPRAEPDDPDDNRVYVWLDGDHAETRHHVEGEISANLGALVESLQDQVQYLREQLDREREANRENRRLLAAALERIPPQLEAPSQPPGVPETAAGESEGPPEPRGGDEGPEEGSERPWWRRMFGG